MSGEGVACGRPPAASGPGRSTSAKRSAQPRVVLARLRVVEHADVVPGQLAADLGVAGVVGGARLGRRAWRTRASCPRPASGRPGPCWPTRPRPGAAGRRPGSGRSRPAIMSTIARKRTRSSSGARRSRACLRTRRWKSSRSRFRYGQRAVGRPVRLLGPGKPLARGDYRAVSGAGVVVAAAAAGSRGLDLLRTQAQPLGQRPDAHLRPLELAERPERERVQRDVDPVEPPALAPLHVPDRRRVAKRLEDRPQRPSSSTPSSTSRRDLTPSWIVAGPLKVRRADGPPSIARTRSAVPAAAQRAGGSSNSTFSSSTGRPAAGAELGQPRPQPIVRPRALEAVLQLDLVHGQPYCRPPARRPPAAGP